MFVLQDVPVHTDAEVGGSGLIGNLRYFVFLVVSPADTSLEDGEPLVVQIDAQGSFVLSMVAEHEHGGTYEVERHGKAPEEGDGVFLHAEHLQLRL